MESCRNFFGHLVKKRIQVAQRRARNELVIDQGKQPSKRGRARTGAIYQEQATWAVVGVDLRSSNYEIVSSKTYVRIASPGIIEEGSRQSRSGKIIRHRRGLIRRPGNHGAKSTTRCDNRPRRLENRIPIGDGTWYFRKGSSGLLDFGCTNRRYPRT